MKKTEIIQKIKQELKPYAIPRANLNSLSKDYLLTTYNQAVKLGLTKEVAK